MKELTLAVERRETTGTSKAHALRKAGKVPAVLFGHGAAPTHLALDAKALSDALHHGARTGLVTLKLDGKTLDTALVRALARHPVSQQIEHVDLQRVTAHEAVHAKLPVVTVGNPRGVREFGGVLDVLVHEVEIEGPADHLPESLEIDVSALGIHQHVTAAEIPLPAGFTMLTAPETLIVSVEASKIARQLEEAAGTLGEQPVPEVIGETPE